MALMLKIYATLFLISILITKLYSIELNKIAGLEIYENIAEFDEQKQRDLHYCYIINCLVIFSYKRLGK